MRPPHQRGQGVVEALVTLPVFLILVFGLFQLFLVSIAQVKLVYAAFCAARVGAVRNADILEMEAAAKRVLSRNGVFPPEIMGSCRVEKLGSVNDGDGKHSSFSEEPVELIQIRVHWDYPLSIPIPLFRPPGMDSGGIFGILKRIPLQASWTAVNFSEPPKTEKGRAHVRK